MCVENLLCRTPGCWCWRKSVSPQYDKYARERDETITFQELWESVLHRCVCVSGNIISLSYQIRQCLYIYITHSVPLYSISSVYESAWLGASVWILDMPVHHSECPRLKHCRCDSLVIAQFRIALFICLISLWAFAVPTTKMHSKMYPALSLTTIL